MMQTSTKQQSNKETDEAEELGFALLIAEGEEGGYEPVAMVSTIREAREIAGSDFQNRMLETQRGAERMHPVRYAVWKQGERGTYRIVSTFEAD